MRPDRRYGFSAMARNEGSIFPALLRHHRHLRGLSQLDLAVASDVSSRHVSFLETGRAQPSREMVLRLGACLSVSLRDQNELLRAAGFPPAYAEPSPHGGLPPFVDQAIERMMQVHEPFPMTLLDRSFDVLRSNAGGTRLLERFVAEPAALGTTPNAYRLLFDPRLVRPFVRDWAKVARSVVARLHRETLLHPTNTALSSLLRSLFDYPDVPQSFRQPDFSEPNEPVLVLRLARGATSLAFLTTLTHFNAPGNVTVEEVTIESYFPLDHATEVACAAIAQGGEIGS
jgi:transcriptional regulator with XRE-family HTH domain